MNYLWTSTLLTTFSGTFSGFPFCRFKYKFLVYNEKSVLIDFITILCFIEILACIMERLIMINPSHTKSHNMQQQL